MEDIHTFLARHPPFDALDEGDLRAVAATAVAHGYRAGEVVLVEDGPPVSQLHVIASGSMELVHENEVIYVLEPGDCFGHPSLITGLGPAFTVRAHEDSNCYLIPREPALRVLGRPAGTFYVATTLRERLSRTGHTVHALPELATARVSSLAHPPAFCEADTPIRELATRLTDRHDSAMLLRLAAGLGIVTDADLRARVVTGELPLDAPASAVARTPVLTAPPEQLAIDATIDMLAAGAEHLAVVAGSEVIGVVSAADLMGLDVRSPFALRHTIINAPDEDALVAVVSHLPRMFRLLLDAGVTPRDLGRVLTLQNDAATMRLIDLSISRHGVAPVPWAWLLLGSAARREFTLGSDQDNALAYADSDDETAVDAYFARLAAEVNGGLARCGFGADNNDVMARNPLWRMSESRWLNVFDDCLISPDESHLVRATVSFDFRHGPGGLAIVPPLVQRLQRAREHPDFMRQLARTATDFHAPLGFRGAITVTRRGHEAGTVDLKRGGIIPIVSLARFHALAAGVTISPTLDRLAAARDVGALDEYTADSLVEAFNLICRTRSEHHAACIDQGRPIDNLVMPDAMPPIARIELREAFRSISRAQKRLGVYVPQGL